MKAIYRKIDDTIYRVCGDTKNPTVIARIPKTTNNVVTNEQAQTVSTTLYHLIDGDTADATNAELYTDITDTITADAVTRIRRMKNKFNMIVEYSVLDGRNKVIEHKLELKENLKATDVAIIMGVDASNNCTYRYGKQMKESIKLKVSNNSPYGVMASKRKNVKIRIDDILIYQELSTKKFKKRHLSTKALKRYASGDALQGLFYDQLLVFAMSDEGMTIEPISLPFLPCTVSIGVNILDVNFVVAYDDSEINEMLLQNKAAADEDEDDGTVDDGSDDDGLTEDDGSYDDGTVDDGSDDDGSTEDDDGSDDGDSGITVDSE